MLPESVQSSIAAADDDLPCYQCFIAAQQARDLARTRLGRLERLVMVMAANTPDIEGVVISADVAGEISRINVNPNITRLPRAEMESRLRAARKLNRAGLVWLRRRNVRESLPPTAKRGGVRFRQSPYQAARITPMGKAIYQKFEAEIVSGKPIRWDERIQKAIDAFLLDATTLLGMFYDALANERAIYRLVGRHNPDYNEVGDFRLKALTSILDTRKAGDASAENPAAN